MTKMTEIESRIKANTWRDGQPMDAPGTVGDDRLWLFNRVRELESQNITTPPAAVALYWQEERIKELETREKEARRLIEKLCTPIADQDPGWPDELWNDCMLWLGSSASDQ